MNMLLLSILCLACQPQEVVGEVPPPDDSSDSRGSSIHAATALAESNQGNQDKTRPVNQVTGGKGAYAVVVSEKTYKKPAWRAVVNTLRKKYDGTVIVYPVNVALCVQRLSQVFPKHACFVVEPQDAGREFVVAVHRLTRLLDADPYTDVQWGILTGYEAKDALRIARTKKPLLVTRGAAGCGIDLALFDEGMRFSEMKKNAMWTKKIGGQEREVQCASDTTSALVSSLNDYKPHLFATSGHATHRDWQIGFSYRNGQFRCENGNLFGLDLSGKQHAINSPNPKVYLASGNCLMGLIEDRETMALAWMHSAGVHQMTGYVVSTWFGYGGWGVHKFFFEGHGRHTLAESFYLNNQALVHQLQTRFRGTASTNFDQWDIEQGIDILERLVKKHHISGHDELGLLWDRDTVAFYGDPRWEARMKRKSRPSFTQTLTCKKGEYLFTVETHSDGKWERPPMAILPSRIKDPKITRGANLEPVITDNFVLIGLTGDFKKGQKYQVAFRGVLIPYGTGE